jgi:putative transposase
MTHAFQSLLCLLVQFFAPRHNAQIRLLKAQIRILRRRLPKEHIVPDPEEKAELLRIGSEIGHDVKPVLEIVKPETYRRWINDAKKGKQPKKSGRPKLSPEVHDLVVRMGKENLLWGYRRIVGELKKLGHSVATTTVKRILREHGIHPTPEKAQTRQPPMPWTQFIHAHLESLVAVDFFTKPVHTLRGTLDAHVLVWLHLKTRKVFCSPATFNPDDKWILQQARNAAMWMEEEQIYPTMLIMDHDTKFTLHFRQFWKELGVRPKQIPIRAPQANAFVESFVGRLKSECLNHFCIFSRRQLDYIVAVWVRHFLTQRPHRGVGMDNHVLDPSFKPQSEGIVRCHEQLGGLIKSYYRQAA